MMAYSATMDTDMAKFVKTKKRINKKNSTKIDVEKYAYSLWGVNVMQIPGMSANSIMQLIGELGHDFGDKFDTAAKFCRWCNIVPNTKISGGKVLSSKVPKRKNPVGQIFRMCANTLKDSKRDSRILFPTNEIKRRSHAGNSRHCAQTGKELLHNDQNHV